MNLLVIGYIIIFMVLSWFATTWHLKHSSPLRWMLHDLVVAAIWPADIVVRLLRAVG